MASTDQTLSSSARNGHFATTRWSVVLAVGDPSSSESRTALETLCQTYWYPLYAFVRRQGRPAVDAQDLVQGFFARLLDKEFLQTADQQRGRFRSFLLTLFKRFLSNERKYDEAEKRGGGQHVMSLDIESGEERFQMEPTDEWTPERLFERRWALTLLDHVLVQLGEDYRAKGKEELFDQLRVFLTANSTARSYGEIAADLEMTEGAVKVAVHRLRQRYRNSLRYEIASTVESVDDVDDELNHLLNALRSD